MNNRRLVFALIALVFASLACNFLSPGSANAPGKSAEAPKVDFTAPAQPLNVTVALDEKSSVRGMVTPKGGRMKLTAADGTLFTLEIPANALKADMLVTMTAVKSLDGAPLGNEVLAAVQLEPSGLVFDDWVTLTIAPAKEIPIEKQIIFNYEGSGQDYHLAVVDPKSREIKIKLLGFSGAGVGSGDDTEWAATLQSQASEASARLLQALLQFEIVLSLFFLLFAKQLAEHVLCSGGPLTLVDDNGVDLRSRRRPLVVHSVYHKSGYTARDRTCLGCCHRFSSRCANSSSSRANTSSRSSPVSASASCAVSNPYLTPTS